MKGHWGGNFPSFAEYWYYQKQSGRAGRSVFCNVLWFSHTLAGGSLLLCVPGFVRFEMPAGWIVKLSFYLVIWHLPVPIMLLALFAGAYMLILWNIALVLIVPGWFFYALLKQRFLM